MAYLSLLLVFLTFIGIGDEIDNLVLRGRASAMFHTFHAILSFIDLQLIGLKLIVHFLLSYIGKDLARVLFFLFFPLSIILLLGATYFDGVSG